jgi:FAD/FMN-containing dehydrogenase
VTLDQELGTVTVDEAALADLRMHFRGPLLRQGDEGYDEARQVWNAMVDHYPALIARCRGTADVVAAVNFGRERGLRISVRGGGHNVAGHAVAEGGLMIDLSLMRAVIVDPKALVARAQGGATFRDLDLETQAHGLVTTGGHVSHTGIGGFTTGGGIGWLARSYGLTSDNLVRAEVVTADGRIVTASETENADLFWGIRGGGGNFGIVTTFTYRLHPFGPMVVGGLAMWPFDRAPEVLRFFRDFVEEIPSELTVLTVFITAPPLPFVPPELQGQKVFAIAACYAGEIADGMRAVQPIKDLAPAVDMLGPIPYVVLQTLIDEPNAPGRRYYGKTEYVEELSDEIIDILVASAATMPSPFTQLTFQHYGGGAIGALPADATAFNHRDAKFVFFVISAWMSAQDDADNIAWARSLAGALHPFSSGAYVNFLGPDDDDRIKAAYPPETYARLAALKAKYDPENLFRLNANIPPATAT